MIRGYNCIWNSGLEDLFNKTVLPCSYISFLAKCKTKPRSFFFFPLSLSQTSIMIDFHFIFFLLWIYFPAKLSSLLLLLMAIKGFRIFFLLKNAAYRPRQRRKVWVNSQGAEQEPPMVAGMSQMNRTCICVFKDSLFIVIFGLLHQPLTRGQALPFISIFVPSYLQCTLQIVLVNLTTFLVRSIYDSHLQGSPLVPADMSKIKNQKTAAFWMLSYTSTLKMPGEWPNLTQ